MNDKWTRFYAQGKGYIWQRRPSKLKPGGGSKVKNLAAHTIFLW